MADRDTGVSDIFLRFSCDCLSFFAFLLGFRVLDVLSPCFLITAGGGEDRTRGGARPGLLALDRRGEDQTRVFARKKHLELKEHGKLTQNIKTTKTCIFLLCCVIFCGQCPPKTGHRRTGH